MDGILLFIANEIMIWIRFDEKLHASMKTSDSCLLNIPVDLRAFFGDVLGVREFM